MAAVDATQKNTSQRCLIIGLSSQNLIEGKLCYGDVVTDSIRA
jgi:hypothetical protein